MQIHRCHAEHPSLSLAQNLHVEKVPEANSAWEEGWGAEPGGSWDTVTLGSPWVGEDIPGEPWPGQDPYVGQSCRAFNKTKMQATYPKRKDAKR